MIGAGTDNKSPVKGAVRWIPLYWSMSSVGDRYNSVWKIGSPVGISTGASYTMYIFFKQQVYNGKLWIDTETVESPVERRTSTIDKGSPIDTYLTLFIETDEELSNDPSVDTSSPNYNNLLNHRIGMKLNAMSRSNNPSNKD